MPLFLLDELFTGPVIYIFRTCFAARLGNLYSYFENSATCKYACCTLCWIMPDSLIEISHYNGVFAGLVPPIERKEDIVRQALYRRRQVNLK
jgi:hypothetical protein